MELWKKPPLYLKLFIWMVVQARFKDHGDLKRGQFFTTLEDMRNAMAWKVGYRTMKPTLKEIRGVTKFLTKDHMIVTMKVTHGMLITILNYDYYQNISNYEGHNEGSHKGHKEGTILRKKGRKKGNITAEEIQKRICSLRARYPGQNLIDQVFKAIASTRKSNRVADSVLLAQLQKWQKYPVEQVEGGIRIYLEKDHAGQGKRENYLLGIIRKQNVQSAEQESTGSVLLDDYYAGNSH